MKKQHMKHVLIGIASACLILSVVIGVLIIRRDPRDDLIDAIRQAYPYIETSEQNRFALRMLDPEDRSSTIFLNIRMMTEQQLSELDNLNHDAIELTTMNVGNIAVHYRESIHDWGERNHRIDVEVEFYLKKASVSLTIYCAMPRDIVAGPEQSIINHKRNMIFEIMETIGKYYYGFL